MLFRIAAIKHQTETAYKLAMRAGAKKISALLNGTYSPDEEQSPEAQAKIATGGMTLHQACCQNQSEVVEALLTGGADVNLVNNSQHSALYYATENGFTEIVEQLLMAGAEG